tara:strand:- start:148 stop:1017 length:870 start_codon:yes stop_codon:yes gene_type:complete
MIANIKNNNFQQTIKSPISFCGIGLHSGIHSNVKILPSKENSGINFVRSDLNDNNVIKALWSNVSSTNLSTTISNNHASISTIEHLMSALSGMHIDNVDIYVDGPEIPIMDGSSKPFVDLIRNSDFVKQKSTRKILKVLKEIEVKKDDSYAKLIPNNEFSVDFEIEFESHLINKQSCQLQLINGNYISDISSARTFGFEKEVNQLRANGLALGGSLDNAVVVGENHILNSGGLRYKDEFVRHKILDSIGDLYLAGYPVQGFFYGKKSGHFLNNQLLKKLLSNNKNFEII